MRLVDGEKINRVAFPNPYSQNTSERDQYFAYERAKFDFWEKVKGLPTIDPVKDLCQSRFGFPWTKMKQMDGMLNLQNMLRCNASAVSANRSAIAMAKTSCRNFAPTAGR